jgi:hypothetical protein
VSICAETLRVTELPATSLTVFETTVGTTLPLASLVDSSVAVRVAFPSVSPWAGASPETMSAKVNSCVRGVLRQVVLATSPGVAVGPVESIW